MECGMRISDCGLKEDESRDFSFASFAPLRILFLAGGAKLTKGSQPDLH
jgi:hypothetical protein